MKFREAAMLLIDRVCVRDGHTRCALTLFFITCNCSLTMAFNEARLSFSSSLWSRRDFGTPPHAIPRAFFS